MYEIRFAKGVRADLKRMAAYYRGRVLDTIETQRSDTPTTPARNRKLLVNLTPPWEAEPPIWEFRVGDYRVFYDVSDEERVVYVRAIRRQPAGQTAEEIL